MKLVTCCFDYSSKSDYTRLERVYRASCAAVMPEVPYEHHELCAPKIKPGYSTGMCSNTLKLKHWVRLVEDAQETICLTDCDMLALRSVADADALDFDLAYTTRTHATIPINGGVVFVRPTPAGKAIMRRWLEINDQMFHNHILHEMWRRTHAGMNQAAFGCLLKHPRVEGARLLPIPCAQWNACNEDWPGVPLNGARLVHLKGFLRRALLHNEHVVSPQVAYIVKEWRKYGL